MKEEIKNNDKLDLILKNQSLILELLKEYLIKDNINKDYYEEEIKKALTEISDRLGG